MEGRIGVELKYLHRLCYIKIKIIKIKIIDAPTGRRSISCRKRRCLYTIMIIPILLFESWHLTRACVTPYTEHMFILEVDHVNGKNYHTPSLTV